jgi:phosphatidylglycerophosphate synthase
MRTVHLLPWTWAAAGAVVLLGMLGAHAVSAGGAAAGVGYLLLSTGLLVAGLARRGSRRLGPANAVTATRSALVGLLVALVASSPGHAVAPALLIGIAAPALALDAVDGLVARRTGSVSELGARFDMEVDAFLLLVLGAAATPLLGPWVLAIGLMRYAFVAAAVLLPWMRATLPPRYWRKVVTACCGIASAVGAAGVLPAGAASAVGAAALLLLVESFGRDVIWLARRARRDAADQAASLSRTGAGSVVSSAPVRRPANTQVR